MTDILYLHNSSLISGGERSLLQLWRGVDRKAYALHVCLPSDGPLADEARALGVNVLFWKAPALRPWNVVPFVVALVSLAAVVRGHRVQLIHSYTPRNNFMASLVGRWARVPVIWHERNLCWGQEKDVSARWSGLADRVICNSQAVAMRFASRSGDIPGKVRTILNGVDLDHFAPTADRAAAKRAAGWEGRKVVGLVSNLEPRKGVETFLQIASIMARRRDDILFVVVGGSFGSGPAREEELRSLAVSCGLENKIVWTGFQADVRPYCAAFDVSCNVTEKEACSRAVLEAMAMGIAVVAFRSGGNPELVEDRGTGLLVPSGDTVVFASRLTALVDNEQELIMMGARARARAMAFFDIRRNTTATLELYRELLERHA